MEKNSLQLRPALVAISRMGKGYTILNLCAEETADGQWACYAPSLTGVRTNDRLLSAVSASGILPEVSASEWVDVIAALGWEECTLDYVLAFVLAKQGAVDEGASVNHFVVDGARVWRDKATRVGLVNSITAQKNAGQAETTLWLGGKGYVLGVDAALSLLAEVELYAAACYCVTQEKLAEIAALDGLAALLAYDCSAGYPSPLSFTLTE